jgi:hypothetical protein
MTTRRLGPKALTGAAAAKRTAVVLLDVLSGGCSAAEGGRRLGISLMRYYALETRALQGLLEALEPRSRRRANPAAAAEAMRREQLRLEREVLRLQALVRATQRAVAVAPPVKETRRRRRTAARATKVIAQLRATTSEAPATTG